MKHSNLYIWDYNFLFQIFFSILLDSLVQIHNTLQPNSSPRHCPCVYMQRDPCLHTKPFQVQAEKEKGSIGWEQHSSSTMGRKHWICHAERLQLDIKWGISTSFCRGSTRGLLASIQHEITQLVCHLLDWRDQCQTTTASKGPDVFACSVPLYPGRATNSSHYPWHTSSDVTIMVL